MPIASILKIIGELALAAFLGGLIGLERYYARKEAGLRTFALVSLGSALFIILNQEAVAPYSPGTSFDPSRVLSQIILGIGFIGAGVIILRRGRVTGLTTASSLWVVAGIGAAVGLDLYWLAIFVSVLTIIILSLLYPIEQRLASLKDKFLSKEEKKEEREEEKEEEKEE